jgi:4-azaleucine resistance transporter AzlC
MIPTRPRAGARAITNEPLPQRGAIVRAAAGIGLYAGLLGITFGAVALAAGLSVIGAVAMSAVMFTGASQFALVGVIATGGSPLAGISAALLLGVRNAFYGVPLSGLLRPRGLRRLPTAQFVIDETTAMALAQSSRPTGRFAFWVTGVTLYVLWTSGTLVGALLGTGIDTSALGLDAAAPAIFLALLWPQVVRRRGPAVALGAAAVALVLIPLAPAGVPIVAAAGVALFAGIAPSRRRDDEEDR